jgi:hypothetical protein
MTAEDHRLSLTEHLRGSEFGGVAGDPQPQPHELSPGDTLRAMYASDTTNPEALTVVTDEAAPSLFPQGA